MSAGNVIVMIALLVLSALAGGLTYAFVKGRETAVRLLAFVLLAGLAYAAWLHVWREGAIEAWYTYLLLVAGAAVAALVLGQRFLYGLVCFLAVVALVVSFGSDLVRKARMREWVQERQTQAQETPQRMPTAEESESGVRLPRTDRDAAPQQDATPPRLSPPVQPVEVFDDGAGGATIVFRRMPGKPTLVETPFHFVRNVPYLLKTSRHVEHLQYGVRTPSGTAWPYLPEGRLDFELAGPWGFRHTHESTDRGQLVLDLSLVPEGTSASLVVTRINVPTASSEYRPGEPITRAAVLRRSVP